MNCGERHANTSSVYEHTLYEEKTAGRILSVGLSIVTRLRWTSQESWFGSLQGHDIIFFLLPRV